MAFPLLAVGAALGGLGGLIGGIKSGKAAKSAANAQAGIAKTQQDLFHQTIPYYQDLLQKVQGYAGTLGQGTYGNPQDQLRLQQANQNINQNLGRAQDQLSFGLGRRGLAGSNLDVAGRAALLANSENQRSGFERQLALQAPMEYERRLGLLANLMNPGLGMGQLAGSTFGQQAQNFGAQAGQAGANLGSSIQNFMMYDALRRANQQQTPPGNPYQTSYTPPFTPGFGMDGGYNGWS